MLLANNGTIFLSDAGLSVVLNLMGGGPGVWEPFRGSLRGQNYSPSSARMLCAFFILLWVQWNFPEVTWHIITQQIDCRSRFKYSFSSNSILVWSLIFFMYFHQNNILQQTDMQKIWKSSCDCQAKLKEVCKKVKTVSLLAKLFFWGVVGKYNYFPYKRYLC